jgi:HemK-like putative methylase
LHLCETVQILQGDLFEPVIGQRFDLVVSNPPYLAERERAALPPELAHEPDLALFGGVDGLEVLHPLVMGVSEYLTPGGRFLVEVDPRQAAEVASWCAEAELREIEILRDLAHRPRGVGARGCAGGDRGRAAERPKGGTQWIASS